MGSISEVYDLIYNRVKELDVNSGDDISYFEFTECVEDVGFDIDDVDIEKFEELYNINIG